MYMLILEVVNSPECRLWWDWKIYLKKRESQEPKENTCNYFLLRARIRYSDDDSFQWSSDVLLINQEKN